MSTRFERWKQTLGLRLTGWLKIPLTAAVRTPEGYEPVARFLLELSLKRSERGVL